MRKINRIDNVLFIGNNAIFSWFKVAPQEGFEPSARGFGDHSSNL